MSTPAVKQFITSKASNTSDPVVKEYFQKLAEYYEKRLWHQLTLQLEDFVNLPQFDSGDDLLTLYHNFISDFERKMNPLTYAKILLKIIRQIKDLSEAISFLTKVSSGVKQDTEKEAYALLLAHIAWLKLQKGQLDEAYSDGEKVESFLNSLTGADPALYSSYYHLLSEYYKIKVEPTRFYRSSLLYLVYTPLETLSPAAQSSLAFDMGVAALVSNDIYNFGELLAHPILNSLDGTAHSWLKEFLFAFNSGQVEQFESFLRSRQKEFESVTALTHNRALLQEKIALLALMELVFNKPSDGRTLPFSTVAAAAKLKEEEVELLVMKALSVGLIKGEIDEVEQKVTITWVQPRVLDLTQVKKLKDRVSQWKDQVKNVLYFMENQTAPELLA